MVHRDALLSVSLPAGAEWELLNRYRSTRSGPDNTLLVHLGDLTSGQTLSVVVRLTFSEGREDAATSVRVKLADSERELSWRYATHEANDSQPRDLVVDREVAALYAVSIVAGPPCDMSVVTVLYYRYAYYSTANRLIIPMTCAHPSPLAPIFAFRWTPHSAHPAEYEFCVSSHSATTHSVP